MTRMRSASGLILTVDDPDRGAMRQMGNVAWLASDQGAVAKTSSIRGEDAKNYVAQVLSEPPRDMDKEAQAAGWLDNLKVVDLTNVIAGPTIASTLARFGAEAIHVQPVSPSVDPWNTVVFGLQANRGKESALLNLRTDAGREALNRLIRKANVITLNATDAQRDGLGLSPDDIKAINPEAILVQLDAFGGPMRGPKSDHLGYDDLAQAATGIMVRFRRRNGNTRRARACGDDRCAGRARGLCFAGRRADPETGHWPSRYRTLLSGRSRWHDSGTVDVRFRRSRAF